MYGSGIWSIFTTDLDEGDVYKYNVVGCDNVSRLKSDPYGTFAELRPKTASVVYEEKNYKWKDEKYLEKRIKEYLIMLP